MFQQTKSSNNSETFEKKIQHWEN